MPYGRCDIVNISKGVEISDYQIMSLNFQLSDVFSNELQISMPKDTFFVINTISLLVRAKPSETGDEAIAQNLAYS